MTDISKLQRKIDEINAKCGFSEPEFIKNLQTFPETMKNENIKTNPCPEFPFFGARYPDARCIDGDLWDLDSWDNNLNGLTSGGEIPCPFCNTEAFIEYDPFGWVDDSLVEILDEDEDVTELAMSKAKEMAHGHYNNWINDKIERYGN